MRKALVCGLTGLWFLAMAGAAGPAAFDETGTRAPPEGAAILAERRATPVEDADASGIDSRGFCLDSEELSTGTKDSALDTVVCPYGSDGLGIARDGGEIGVWWRLYFAALGAGSYFVAFEDYPR